MGTNTLVILRNHGLLTGGGSPAESVGWFVTAERVAEVHVKAPDGKAISDEAAKALAASCAGLKVFQANGCSGLGDDGLVALAKSCKRLERLDVRGCARVTEHGLDVCAKQQPWAKVLAKRA